MKRIAVIAIAFAVIACAENAGSFHGQIAKAMAEMDRTEGDATRVVAYHPAKTNEPYTLILFPERRVFESELIGRGVEPEVAKRIFRDLSKYGVGEKERPMMVIAQPGKPPTAASYYGRDLVYIDNLMIVKKSGGDTELTLVKRGDTYYITDAR